MTIRVPTWEEFLAYDGAHTKLLWKESGPDWVCPACGRNKFQVLRWTKRFPGSKGAFMGWIAPLHKHHDHGHDWLRSTSSPARFPQTLICDQCNAADGVAKRKLGLPSDFSFSPVEISAFVKAQAHGKHTIDYGVARAIYEAIQLTPRPVPPHIFWT